MTVDVLLRSEKGSPLTHAEVDQNFKDLQDAVNGLADLQNVSISTPINGQVLAYNGISGLWENSTLSGSSSTFIAGENIVLSDIDASTKKIATVDEIYQYKKSIQPIYELKAGVFASAITTNGVLFPGIGTHFTASISGTGAQISSSNFSKGFTVLLDTGTTATGQSSIRSASTILRDSSFKLYCRIEFFSYASDMEIAIGISAVTLASTTPSTTANSILLLKDKDDTTLKVLTRNASTGTKTETGVTPTAGQLLDFSVEYKKGDSFITVNLMDPSSGAVYMDNVSITADLPAAGSSMFMQAICKSSTGTTRKYLGMHRFKASRGND